jgi:hypothetical protein
MKTEFTITNWPDAKKGDTVGITGEILVKRGIARKYLAKVLAQQINGKVWIDGPRTWAVVKGVA